MTQVDRSSRKSLKLVTVDVRWPWKSVSQITERRTYRWPAAPQQASLTLKSATMFLYWSQASQHCSQTVAVQQGRRSPPIPRRHRIPLRDIFDLRTPRPPYWTFLGLRYRRRLFRPTFLFFLCPSQQRPELHHGLTALQPRSLLIFPPCVSLVGPLRV